MRQSQVLQSSAVSERFRQARKLVVRGEKRDESGQAQRRRQLLQHIAAEIKSREMLQFEQVVDIDDRQAVVAQVQRAKLPARGNSTSEKMTMKSFPE